MQALIAELLRHYDDLRRHLTRELRDADRAADITQSAFERVYASLRLDRPESGHAGHAAPRALLFHVARNLCIDEARHHRVTREWARDKRHADAHSAQPCSEQLFAHRQLLARVVEVIEALPPRRREVFLLFRAYGHSHAEIAGQLGITEMAVAKHLVRAVIDCAKALKALRAELLEPVPFFSRQDLMIGLAEDQC